MVPLKAVEGMGGMIPLVVDELTVEVGEELHCADQEEDTWGGVRTASGAETRGSVSADEACDAAGSAGVGGGVDTCGGVATGGGEGACDTRGAAEGVIAWSGVDIGVGVDLGVVVAACDTQGAAENAVD